MKNVIVALIIATVSLYSCGSNKTESEKANLSLRFDWIPTMSFAGDIVTMNNLSKSNELNLKLEAAGEGVDPIKMVISGTNNIGIIGLDKMLLANEKGADLVAIGIADYVSPTVFMSKKEQNILKPQDFIGKKVGVQSGGATEFVYRALIKKLNLEGKGINEVQIGFDMKPFVENQYDVRPGFIFDEVVYLDQNNIEYNLIEPKDYGIIYPGRVYFVKREFLNKNKLILKNFIYETKKGWEFALNNPNEAIIQLQAFEPKINFQRELDGLKKAKPYFSGFEGKVLYPDIKACEEMVITLKELNILKSTPNFKEYFDISLIEE